MSNPLKKTMVFLGLAEDELDEPKTAAPAKSEAAPAHTESTRPAVQRAAVTPLRRVTPTRQAGQQQMNEILTVHPTEYRDARVVAESFRDGIPVIMNLSRMPEGDAKRLVDFASGLTMGLNGQIERVTSKVFLLSPEHIEIGTDAPRESEDGSFFVAPAS